MKQSVKKVIAESIGQQDVYTMQDWGRDKTLKVKEGQIIEPKVFHQLLNSVPPATLSNGIFQPGEAYSTDPNTGEDLFQTFKHVGDDYYKYIGLKPYEKHKQTYKPDLMGFLVNN